MKKAANSKEKITKSQKIITNTTSLLVLEFIQIADSCSLPPISVNLFSCRGLRGRAKSPRPRRQVKKARRRSYRYVENVFGRQRRHRTVQPAAVEWVVWIHSFKENKPNFKNIKTVSYTHLTLPTSDLV